MPFVQAWESDLEMAMAMAVLMKVMPQLFVVSVMYLVEVLVVLGHINHCKMEDVIMAAALKMGRMWRGAMVLGLGLGRFP